MLAAWLDLLHRQLGDQQVQLRFRCNRRKLLHYEPAKGRTGSRYVLHPGLFVDDQAKVVAALKAYAGQHDPESIQVLQQAVDALGKRLQAGGPGAAGGLNHWLPLFAEAHQDPLTRCDQACRSAGIRLELVDTDRLLLTADHRNEKRGRCHYRLLAFADVLEEVPQFLTGRRGTYPAIDRRLPEAFAAIQAAIGGYHEQAIPIQDLVADSLASYEPIGQRYQPDDDLRRIAGQYFPDLPLPVIGWSRGAAEHRSLRSIRYGSYRAHPAAEIRLHPRLQQAWVARVFVEHVIHHELCHHAQACRPVRGERPHSLRFRAWERAFDHFDQACAWERSYQAALLAAPADIGPIAI